MNEPTGEIPDDNTRHSRAGGNPEEYLSHNIILKYTPCKYIRKHTHKVSTSITLLPFFIFILILTALSPQLTRAHALDPDDPAGRATEQPSTIKHPFLLIDRQLVETNIDLLSITKGRLRFTSRMNPNASRPIDDILILMRINKQISQTPPVTQHPNTVLTPDQPVSQSPAQNKEWTGPTIRLTDGRLLTGQLKAVVEDGAALLWRSDIIGQVRITTDDITRIYFRPKSPATNPNQPTVENQTGDVVELTNGDRMIGFISFPDSEHITVETNRDTTTLDMNRISSITLENESIPPPYNACRVFLRDGSIFDIDRSKLHTRGQGVRFVPMNFSIINNIQTDPSIEKPISTNRWADFNSLRALIFNAGSIQPLAVLTPNPQSNNSDDTDESIQWFDSAIPPEIINNNNQPLSLNDMRFEGPAQFRYPIPARASRFAAGASIPRAALDWADFNLVILADDRELYKRQFNINNSADEIIIAVPQSANTLTIRIEENNRGPIQNVITLRHPFFLLNKP